LLRQRPIRSVAPYFIAGFEGSGLSFKHLLIWVKQHFVIGMSDYHYRHEPILYGWVENGTHHFTNDRTQTRSSKWTSRTSAIIIRHKTYRTCARVVANGSRRGEAVYDPFCGSGTTLLAAHQLGRIGYGMDIDPGYVAVTLERMTQLGLKPELADSLAQSANIVRPWDQ
jgi:DNA modification methylase